MGLAGLFFSLNRTMELLTLIPIVGMLSYFVNLYTVANALTPNYILTLFIVSTLASVWALVTLVRRQSTRRSAGFVAFIDLCFAGALIAGVYELRAIANANCTNVYGGFNVNGGVVVTTGDNSGTATLSPLTISYAPFGIEANKTCAMLKASFALGIINVILFLNSAAMAALMHRHERTVVVEKYTSRRRSHDSRRGHSGSRHHSRDSRRNYYV